MLEDFHDRTAVGKVAYSYAGSDPRPLLFHETATTAFYVTIDALNRFQNLDPVGASPYVIPALGLWFMAAESYVSTIYKVAQLDAAQRGTEAVPLTSRLPLKYTAIEDHFGAAIPRPKTPRLEFIEFCALRNTLLHDLTGIKQPTFNHTLFPTAVENVNELDLFQGLIVAINVFTYFSNLFPEADLMPSVAIQGAQEKIDALTTEVLFPAFADLIEAKGLDTSLALILGDTRIAAEAPAPLFFMIKCAGDSAPSVAPTKPLIAWEYFNIAATKRPVDDDKFEVPRYTRADLA